ncbi:glycosyltransferase family 2 protein [uncultured Aquimarina sp.]|uniref:glycosyltransferase family 2 protein n=1 Tax=uncultured Aquimarina sp. TaxID=575652 RepID=UPI00262B6D7D|nr:glycosyltransferase family 2 protein [uncultured Aquimarina sp.]
MKYKFYILIVNYNGYQDTIECLESLYHLGNQNFQTIVIDNSNLDNDFDHLRAWANGEMSFESDTNFPQYVKPLVNKPIDYISLQEEKLEKQVFGEKLLIVKAKENKGFAVANNIALRYIQKFGSSDDYIWLLNNDTVVASDTMNQIKEQLKRISREEIESTLFGTPLREYYEPIKIQTIGGKYHRLSGITSHIGEGLSYTDDFKIDNYKIDYPIGASMIFSMAFLRQVGLMNEEYFLFFEELDWVERAKKIGGKTSIIPVFGVFHKHGKSTLSKNKKQKTEFIDLLSLRNRILFSRKYFKNYLWTVKLFILTVTVLKRIFSGNFGRIPKIIKLIFTT